MASPAPRNYRPTHRDDDPRRAIDDALDGMSADERSESLVATTRALHDGSERYRWHALHAMRHGTSQVFRDALVELLTPEWPEWVGSLGSPQPLATSLFACLRSCAGDDERLVQYALALSEFPKNRRYRVSHFTTFYAGTHGLHVLREHLAAQEPLSPSQARRIGARYSRDAPSYLEELAGSLRSYETEVREKFAEGASARLDAAMLTQLHTWLGLPLS